MIDLEKIKARRTTIGEAAWKSEPSRRPGDSRVLRLDDEENDPLFLYGEKGMEIAEFIAHAPADIDALVAEVEGLEGENNLMGKTLIARGCDEPIAEVVRLGDQVEELEAEVERLRTERNAAPRRSGHCRDGHH